VVLGVVVAKCSGDHPSQLRTWRHSSEALNRLLRGSLRFVSIRFQDNAALDGAAVAAFKNKPAPDNPPLAWIFSKPIAIVAPWMCHCPNMPWSLGNFHAANVDTLICKLGALASGAHYSTAGHPGSARHRQPGTVPISTILSANSDRWALTIPK
jgi:hypothetical protein